MDVINRCDRAALKRELRNERKVNPVFVHLRKPSFVSKLIEAARLRNLSIMYPIYNAI